MGGNAGVRGQSARTNRRALVTAGVCRALILLSLLLQKKKEKTAVAFSIYKQLIHLHNLLLSFFVNAPGSSRDGCRLADGH